MSRSDQVLGSIPVSWNDSSLVQERLSVRQAKRTAKAAERREKSDALMEEGNVCLQRDDLRGALYRYERAVDVHGPSIKPVLLINLAVVYLGLGMYSKAHDAAHRALAGDPRSVEARHCRGTARKHLKMWTAADIDFRTLLALDPTNKDAEAELEFVEEMRCDPRYSEEEEMDSYSDYDAPALDDDPDLGESLSESSDCEHTGNGIPCKFYNRTECKNGHSCRYSHAPDKKSERDALQVWGRNVCRYYLMGVCKFGERCSYLHSKEYLLRPGWWSTTDGVDKVKAAGTGQVFKKQPNGKKKRGPYPRSGFGQSSQRTGTKSRKKPAVDSYPAWEEYDSDGDDELENGMCGFTRSQVDELISYGVKPWDDEAWDVLRAVHDY